MLEIVPNGLLCVAALIVAACAKNDKAEGVRVGSLLLFVWVLYVWPWVHSPSSPAAVLSRSGVDGIQHQHVWMVTDAIASMLTLLFAWRKAWGWAVWACFIVMLCNHTFSPLLDFSVYSTGLDAAFLGQLAILFVIGGPGAWDRLSNWRAKFRRIHGVYPAVRQKVVG